MIPRTPSLRELRANRPANVEILPSATARQVQQKWNKQSQAASREMKKRHASRFEYEHPGTRRARKHAAIIHETKATPGLLLAMAILETLDREQRFTVLGKLAARGRFDANDQAIAYARMSVLNLGEQFDLMNALDQLAKADGGTQ